MRIEGKTEVVGRGEGWELRGRLGWWGGERDGKTERQGWS